jgi:hypothetical protein
MEKSHRRAFPISKQYDATTFAFFITICGLADALLIQYFVSASYAYLAPLQTYYQNLIPSQSIPFQFYTPVLLFGIIIFFLTIAPQLLLSRFLRRIIPALLPQMAAIAYVILLWAQKPVNYLVPTLFAVAYFVVVMAFLQDGLVLALLGKNADRRDMELRSLKVFAKPEQIKEILMTPRIRKSLGLRKEPEETEPAMVFVEKKPGRFEIAIELSKPPDSDTSLLNLAAFDEGRYSLRWSEDLQDYAESKFDYIKGILTRFSVKNELVETESAVSIADFVEDRLQSSITKAAESLGTGLFIIYIGAVVIPMFGGLAGLFPFDLGLGLSIANLVIILGDARRRRGRGG